MSPTNLNIPIIGAPTSSHCWYTPAYTSSILVILALNPLYSATSNSTLVAVAKFALAYVLTIFPTYALASAPNVLCMAAADIA